jgi:diacylglycerol kinase family enzyme
VTESRLGYPRRVSKRYLVVGNPTAQSGKAKDYLDRAIEGLIERGKTAELLPTEPHGRTVAAVERAIETNAPDVVVYMGGDGTFNEVARGILRSRRRPPLGMLPMGTANDQGRSLGVRPGPGAIDTNLDIVVAGHVLHLDVGEVELLEDGSVVASSQFFDCMGWGMQPEILAKRNKDRAEVQEIPVLREIYRDQAVYAGATIERFIASFIEPADFSARIVADGRVITYDRLTDLVVSGTALYAGEWVLDRFSEPDDGKFELVPMQGRRDWASKALRDLAMLPLFQEDLDVIGVTHSEGLSASAFDLQFSGKARIPCQLDGEEWKSGHHFRVKVIKNGLDVITPEGFEPPWRFDRSKVRGNPRP